MGTVPPCHGGTVLCLANRPHILGTLVSVKEPSTGKRKKCLQTAEFLNFAYQKPTGFPARPTRPEAVGNSLLKTEAPGLPRPEGACRSSLASGGPSQKQEGVTPAAPIGAANKDLCIDQTHNFIDQRGRRGARGAS